MMTSLCLQNPKHIYLFIFAPLPSPPPLHHLLTKPRDRALARLHRLVAVAPREKRVDRPHGTEWPCEGGTYPDPCKVDGKVTRRVDIARGFLAGWRRCTLHAWRTESLNFETCRGLPRGLRGSLSSSKGILKLFYVSLN